MPSGCVSTPSANAENFSHSANRGIGLEYCRQLHQRGDDVIAVCRQISDELNQLDVRVESGIDLSSEADQSDLVKRLAGVSLDCVILNAGILQSFGLEDLDPEGIRRQFELNALAPLVLARALLTNMTSGGKIALMTSRMGSIDDNTSGGSYGYRMSKLLSTWPENHLLLISSRGVFPLPFSIQAWFAHA